MSICFALDVFRRLELLQQILLDNWNFDGSSNDLDFQMSFSSTRTFLCGSGYWNSPCISREAQAPSFQIVRGALHPILIGRLSSWDAMALEWPQLGQDFLVCFRKHFKSPLHLDAAFDNDLESAELVQAIFPDMVAEEVMDLVAILMIWKESNVRSFKRARLGVVEQAMVVPLQTQGCSVQDAYKRLVQTNVVSLIDAHTKRRQKVLKLDAESRSKRLDVERKKYTLLLAQVIMDAGLPVVALIQTLDDPQQGWLHLFGTRRCNTLKNRFKAWRPFAVWLELHCGRKFPVQLKDIIDYMQHRIDEGCGKSVPESFHIALSLIEQLGRVPEGERLSDEQLWKSHVRAWTAELAADAPPVRPAEMYTVAMLISLELVVADESQRGFARALAWVVLVMVWGSMRCDDVQSALPHRTTLSNYGLRMVLGKTKTSGPDKIQKEVSVHVYRTVSLSGEDWLGIGYRIWEADPFNFRRDYFVMEPSSDWNSAKRKFVSPSGLSSLISKLLSDLPVPKKHLDGWVASAGTLLLPDGLESHFTGHSPRNFLTSVAAAIGFHRDQRAYLGRWAMGMVASEEYVRTSRQVVFTIQKAVNKSIVTGFDQEYFEDEAIDRLCKAVENSGANRNRIRKRHAVSSTLTGRSCLGGVFPTLEVMPDDWFEVGENEDDEHTLAASIQEQKAKDDAAAKVSSKFFVTISRRTAFRRLHLTGCFVKPSNCTEVRMLDEVEADDFDSICRACKRKMLAENGKDENPESSSTASSSSTVSADEATAGANGSLSNDLFGT